MTTMTIGTIEIEPGTRRRIESEYAAWFDEIEVETKTAELFTEVEADGRIGEFVRYRIAGTVVDCCWTPHFGGVGYGAGTDTRGQKRETVVAWRGYDVARMVAERTKAITLAPGFEVEEAGEYEYAGTKRKTWKIRKTDGGTR